MAANNLNNTTQRVLAAVDAMDAMMRKNAATGGWEMGEKEEKKDGKGEDEGRRRRREEGV